MCTRFRRIGIALSVILAACSNEKGTNPASAGPVPARAAAQAGVSTRGTALTPPMVEIPGTGEQPRRVTVSILAGGRAGEQNLASSDSAIAAAEKLVREVRALNSNTTEMVNRTNDHVAAKP